MGSCGCISSNNNNDKAKRSKSVGDPSKGDDPKMRREDINQITESIFKGEPILKKVPSKDEDAAKKKANAPPTTNKDEDMQNIGQRNMTVLEIQANPTVIREQRTQLGVSEVTQFTQQIPQFTTGIQRDNSHASETMVFEDIEEDIDDSIIDQNEIGFRINTQESYKNVKAIKPLDDKQLRDFDVYKSEMEIISKTRNTVVSMMVKNPRLSYNPKARLSFEPNNKLTSIVQPQVKLPNDPQPSNVEPNQKAKLVIRAQQESYESRGRPLETDTSALFRHLKPKGLGNNRQSRLHKSNKSRQSSSIQSRVSDMRQKLSNTYSVSQPRDSESSW